MIPCLKQFIVICTAVLMVACSKSESNPPSIIVHSNKITCGYEESSQSVQYSIQHATSGRLSARTSQQWISNISVGDNAVSFLVKENNGRSPRTAQISLEYSGAQSVNILVEQQGYTPMIVLTPSSKDVDYAGGNGSFSYSVNNPRSGVELSISCNADWISNVAKTSSGVNYTVAENNSGSSRSAKIVLSYGEYTSAEFTVNQTWSAPEIVLTPSAKEIDYAGGNGSFSYSVNNPRSGVEVSVNCNADWISNVTKTLGGVNYTVSENNSGSSRVGKIILSYGEYATAEFTVNQTWSAPTIVLTPSSKEIDYAGGNGSFSYSVNNPRSGVEVSVSCNADWISNITKTSSSVNYTVSQNNSVVPRIGKIVLSYGVYTMTEFEVSQSGHPVTSITLNNSEISLLIGDMSQLLATVIPADVELVWVSNDSSVASVASNGLVTAVNIGTAVITVSPMNSDLSASCTVTVSKLSGINEGIGEEIWK